MQIHIKKGRVVDPGKGSDTVSDLFVSERLIAVGRTDREAFPTISAALAGAQRGDVIEVEAGEYAESLTLPPGVELRASKGGNVVLVAPAGAHNWTAIDASGQGSTVRGFRISATDAAPMAAGIVVGANDVTVDDVTLEGVMDVGVDVRSLGTMVTGSRFDRLTGTGIRLADEGASLRQNIFRSAGPEKARQSASEQTAHAAIQAVGGVTASFDSNIFMHFTHVVDPEARADELIGRDNFVIVATAKR